MPRRWGWADGDASGGGPLSRWGGSGQGSGEAWGGIWGNPGVPRPPQGSGPEL